MGIPEVYRKFADNSIATYDFADIASGTGYIEFYGGKASSSYVLSNFRFYSQPVYQAPVAIQNTYTKLFDLDFDTLINRPTLIKGLAIVNVPVRLTSASSTPSVYSIAKIRKWDGTTETEIAQEQSGTWTISPAGSNPQNMLSVRIDVPLTNFKKGEYLRLTVEVWAIAAAASTLSVGHDPMGRFDSSGWDSAETFSVAPILTFKLPVRIDL